MRHSALTLPFESGEPHQLADSLRRFRWRGDAETLVTNIDVAPGVSLDAFTNEFWTSRQRAANSLHEVSYRACFKPQLPRFFIERLTQPGDIVYDPFMGRGTTVIEAALMGRVPYACDVNPLSRVLCEPRLDPPALDEVERALGDVDFTDGEDTAPELLVFYHPETLHQISALRRHLLTRDRAGALSRADRWIRMVAVNRLTGHSPGFFSVYTMPPNQAVSARSQAKINARRGQTPPRRNVASIILKKSRSLLRDVDSEVRSGLSHGSRQSLLMVGSSSHTPALESNSVSLVVTSPPFLDVVDYKSDNWLRCWFSGIDASSVPVTIARGIDEWRAFVTRTFRELRRVLRPGGYIAFEVGEVKRGQLRLEDVVIPAGLAAGLKPALVLINAQEFTKTANCWGVTNNTKGTNTNRVVVFRRSG
ncbi:MAG: DNA methyltransferase [Vicinamibacterales bacterium]